MDEKLTLLFLRCACFVGLGLTWSGGRLASKLLPVKEIRNQMVYQLLRQKPTVSVPKAGETLSTYTPLLFNFFNRKMLYSSTR